MVPSPPSWWSVLWWCLAFPLVRCIPGGRKPFKTGTTAGKGVKIGTTCPVPPWRHRYMHNPSYIYIAVPFGFSFRLAPAGRIYNLVGGKAPSVLFGASPCSLLEPRGAVPARWCGVRSCARWPVALARSAGCRLRCVPYQRLRWCVRRCLSAVAGGQGGLACWQSGL